MTGVDLGFCDGWIFGCAYTGRSPRRSRALASAAGRSGDRVLSPRPRAMSALGTDPRKAKPARWQPAGFKEQRCHDHRRERD